VAARLSRPETRSFPPPPYGEFGFIDIDQLPADKRDYLQTIQCN